MYNTELERIKCVIDGYESIIKKYSQNLIIPLNKQFQVAKCGFGFFIIKTPESLHNLNEEPTKAFEIIKAIKAEFYRVSKNATSLSLQLEKLKIYYKVDASAILFIKLFEENVANLVKDETQFSEFNYF